MCSSVFHRYCCLERNLRLRTIGHFQTQKTYNMKRRAPQKYVKSVTCTAQVSNSSVPKRLLADLLIQRISPWGIIDLHIFNVGFLNSNSFQYFMPKKLSYHQNVLTQSFLLSILSNTDHQPKHVCPKSSRILSHVSRRIWLSDCYPIIRFSTLRKTHQNDFERHCGSNLLYLKGCAPCRRQLSMSSWLSLLHRALGCFLCWLSERVFARWSLGVGSPFPQLYALDQQGVGGSILSVDISGSNGLILEPYLSLCIRWVW